MLVATLAWTGALLLWGQKVVGDGEGGHTLC